MQSRRDFVKMLALLAAGTAALPEQIAAFEKYYDANTPREGTSFLAIDEISICGLVPFKSCPLKIELWYQGVVRISSSLNALGGIYFWRAPPDGKIVSRPKEVTWTMVRLIEGTPPDDLWVQANLAATISYIDSNSVRHVLPITTSTGSV